MKSQNPAGPAPVDGELLYFVSGMWCTTCGQTVRAKMLALPDVVQAELNYASKLLTVILRLGADPEAIDRQVQAQAEQIGFAVKRQSTGWLQHYRSELERERSRAIPPALVAITFFLAMWSGMLAWAGYQGGLDGLEQGWLARWSAGFGVPAILIGVIPFTRAGLRALIKSRLLTLDLFVALGAFSVLVLSLVGVVTGQPQTYADSGSMVLVVLLVAKLLEHSLSGYLSDRILYQADCFEQSVDVFRGGGWRSVEVAQVRRGERVRYRAGETISLDGDSECSAAVNAHLINGEAADIELKPGDPVHSGCIARTDLAVRVGEPLGLRMIDRWAESALVASGRPHVFSEKLRYIESRLVQVALLGAATVATVRWSSSGSWQSTAEGFFVGVLVFCPCLFASILPLARQMAHLALAAIAVELARPDCLFDLSRIDKVLLDKTGTLESVESAFCAFDPVRVNSRARVLLSRLCQVSRHPVLRGLEAVTGGTTEEVEMQEVPGEGVTLHAANGDVLVVGRPRYAMPSLPEGENFSALVVFNGVPQGRLVTRKTFDEQGLSFLGSLLERLPANVRIEILSGDPRPGAGDRFCQLDSARVAYSGNLTPEEKAARVGSRTLFVGDGLNDTLAMSQASVSCRVGDRVRGFAPVDLVLAGDNLKAVLKIVAYSHKFVRVLCQTAALAFLYNLMAWTLAATGHFDPLGAVVAMFTSLVVLLLSASRLLRVPPD